jgi:Cupin-like domain/F-box-like
MAPSALPVIRSDVDFDLPPAKRRKSVSSSAQAEEPSNDNAAVRSHPLGVKPGGNAYTASHNLRHSSGGAFRLLDDEVLIQILEVLDAESLNSFSATCKAIYPYARLDELWKTLFIEKGEKVFKWRGTWRRTCLNIPLSAESKIDCTGIFSDIIYRPYFCAHTPLIPYTADIPEANKLPILEDLTSDKFSRDWANRPFILTSPVKQWPAYTHWSADELLERHAAIDFRAEAVDWRLDTYVDYMNDSSDESPLYLFDRSFVEKMGISVGKESGEYWTPDCFGEDLFAVLGDDRPDCRWLIVGPERSGSTFHKDPNATSAWNAVLSGSKYWIMFPPSCAPPGVYVSEDQSEVTSPLSIAEWLLGFHEEARRTKGCVEGVCKAGEILHVPSGWWHLVVNLDASIALTQNFIPEAHLSSAIEFLRDRPTQVSGFRSNVKNPYQVFETRMRERHQELFDKALRELDAQLAKENGKKSRKWEALVQKPEEEEGGFSFGFGDDSDADIP